MWLFEGLKPLFAAFAQEQWGAETAAAVLALAKPAIRLKPNKPRYVGNDRTSDQSRFGGWPLLDPGTEWPVWEPADLPEPERVQLTFVGLLNLAQLSSFRDVTGLPARGFLNFFYAWKESLDRSWCPPWGEPEDEGGWRVVLADPETAAPVQPPDETAVYPAWTLNWQQIDTLPSSRERELHDAFQLQTSGENWTPSDPYTSVYGEFAGELTNHYWTESVMRHQIGGWPDPAQESLAASAEYGVTGEWKTQNNDLSALLDVELLDLKPKMLTQDAETGQEAEWAMQHQIGDWPDPAQEPLTTTAEYDFTGERKAPSRDWRLLLQVDCDHRIRGVEAGRESEWVTGWERRLYFLIRDEDLRAGRFENTWLVGQR